MEDEGAHKSGLFLGWYCKMPYLQNTVWLEGIAMFRLSAISVGVRLLRQLTTCSAVMQYHSAYGKQLDNTSICLHPAWTHLCQILGWHNIPTCPMLNSFLGQPVPLFARWYGRNKRLFTGERRPLWVFWMKQCRK
jgi:hypothetical protein